MLLISLPSFLNAQPYLGAGLQNKGVNFSIGVLAEKFELQAQIKSTLTSMLDPTVEPTIILLTAGYQIPLTFEDDYNYSITVQAGAGFRSYRNYKEDGNSMSDIKTDEKFAYGIEIGQHGELLKWFGTVKHCGKLYFGVGFRCYLWKKIKK